MSAVAPRLGDQRIILVLGGARSGKSRHAESLITRHAPPWTYAATAQAFDDEMTARIALHQTRRDERWHTLDTPLDLAPAIERSPQSPLLIDCLTLWLSNHLLADHDLVAESDALVAALSRRRGPTVVVSNEVGFGIVPDNALARRFRDAAGVLNQRVAAIADRVVLCVAGLPLQVKP